MAETRFVTDGWSDGRTVGCTDGRCDSNMPPEVFLGEGANKVKNFYITHARQNAFFFFRVCILKLAYYYLKPHLFFCHLNGYI